MPLRLRKLRSRATSGDAAAPISTGPPAPDSISATRLRIIARIIFSPSVGFGDQQGVQLLGIDLERVGFADRDAVDEGRPARELAQLAGKVARTMLGHRQLVSVAVAAGDADRARQNHVDAGADLAGLDHVRAIGETPRLSETVQPRDLVGGEQREHLRAARLEGRRRGRVHASSIATSST